MIRFYLTFICFSLFSIVLVPFSLWAQSSAALELLGPTEPVDSGYFLISWEAPQEWSEKFRNLEFFELQSSSEADFSQAQISYRGRDQATFLSGLPNGDYYFRVRAKYSETLLPSVWSEVWAVRVQHHSLKTAILLFSLGAGMFLLLLGVLLHGMGRHREVSP